MKNLKLVKNGFNIYCDITRDVDTHIADDRKVYLFKSRRGVEIRFPGNLLGEIHTNGNTIMKIELDKSANKIIDCDIKELEKELNENYAGALLSMK